MQSAVNPKTGEVLFLVDNQWVKPAQTAINPKTGENAYLVNNEWQVMPMPKAGGADRTLGEAVVTDPITSLLSGVGTMLGSPGQLKQLITGEKPSEEKPKGTIESLAQTLLPFGTDINKMPEKALQKLTPSTATPTPESVISSVASPFSGLQPVGEELKAFGEKQKSAGLKSAEKGREKAIQEAEGFLPEVGAAVGETVKNPALLTSFIFEQLPNFVGTLGGGALTKEAARAFFKEATEKTLGKVGVGGAIATGGAMQAGDIGSETYQTIYDRLVKEGTPPDQAHQTALEKGRMAAAQAGAISVASSFIPGGKALERRFLTEAGKKAGFPGFVPAVGNILGETVQEGTEEGGGKLVSNLQLAQVFPDVDVMKGVGAATGLGALGGGMFGGISNVPSALSRTPQAQPTPPGGAVPPTGGAVPPAPPAAPAVPLEAQLEETPQAVRLAELDRALKEVDLAFQNPNLSAEDFGQLNAMAAQIRSQIAKVQVGEEVTAPVPTPTAPVAQAPVAPAEVMPQAAAPEAPSVEVPTEIPTAEVPEVTPVTPKAAVDETGEKLTYPMFVDLADKGYQLHSFESPRTYENKGGVKYRTLEKDGVRIALEPQQVLFTDPKKPNQQPQLGMGNENDVAFHFIGVDPELRKQGKARQALKDLIDVADLNRYTLYGEPAQLEKEGMNTKQLTDLYAQYGFKPTDESGKVIVREPLVGAEKKLDNLIKGKDEYIKIYTENKKVSPAYAQKAYEAELEYTKALARAVEGHPNQISQEELRDAIKKHKSFFNKLNAISERQKEKEVKPAKPTKEDKVAANKERQAEKKAAAEKAKQPVDTSAVTDLIEGKIKKVLGWTIYKRKEDPEFWYVQSPENHAENKIGPGDDVSTNLDTARARIEQHINDAEYEARKAAEKPAEVKPKIEELVSPEVASAMKDIEFQKRLIKANKEKALTEAQFSKVFNLQQAGKTAEADAQLTKILAKNEKKAKSKEEPIEIAKIEPIKEVEGQPSKEYQAALNKSRKATKAFASAQDGYRKRLITDEEFLAARKRYDDAMAEYDIAYAKEQEKPEPDKPKEVTKKVAPTTSEEEQLIQDAVMFAKAAERTNLDEAKIRDTVENARIKEPETVITKLKGSVESLKNQAKDYLIRKAAEDYREQVGGVLNKDSELVNAIKGGALNIEGKDYAPAFYKAYNINPEKIKKPKAGNEVDAQVVKFDSGIFTGRDAKPEVYDEAAVKFLEGPLTAKMPGKNQTKIDAKDLKDVTPLPIEKKIAVKNKTYEDHKTALTDFTAPQDIRYYLKGIYMDQANGRMMATDGHRGAIINNANFEGVPKLEKGKDIVAPDNSVIEGQFPDMDRVVPKKHLVKSDIINTKEIGDYARGIQKAWRYIDSRYNPVTMKIGGKELGFNSDYIVDMANLFAKMGYETFQASADANGKLFATSPDGKVQQVVMAMREPSTPFAQYVPSKKVEKKVTKAESTKGPFYNNFEPDFTEADFNHSVDDVRKEKIKEQAANSRKITATVKKVANMGSDLNTQYELNRAINAKKALTEEIEAMKQPKTLPEDIMARAAKERAEFQRTGGLDGLSPEAYAVLEALYQKSPDILNGLKLSVRRTERRGVTGSFDPFNRIVTVYKKGISAIFGEVGSEKQAKTMRHEIAHSLEQMMNSDARQVLVNAWANSLQKAIKKYQGDKVYQDYFDAVLDFIENPNESTYRKATDLMPEYSMYQYINPSEFWAVNAEPLLNAQLGGAWARFTKAVKGLWEAIKSVFGFDNRYAVHREFNRIMSGDQQRITKSMLVDFLDQTGVSRKFINNIEEERSLIEDLNLPEVPDHQERSMKDMAVAGFRRMQDWGKEFGSNPGKTATKSLISASDAITKQRIENVYFAAGLDKRDQDKYNGQIKAADGFMAASIAIKNAIHSAHISTQVIIEGGIEYSKEFGQIVAKKAEHSMANVVKLEHAIKQKLGDKLGLQIVNGYFIAKRSRSIQNEFLDASAALRKAQDSGDFAQIAEAQSDYNSIKTAYGKIPNYFRQLNAEGKPMYETIYGEDGEVLGRIPILNDEAIDRAIDMEKRHPELKQMMENWTAVNKNMLDIMAFSGRISKKSAEKLKDIKDYVPWYRIMDDQEDIHNGNLISNYPGGPKKFKAGETERDIDNVVESMIHNVVMMTRGATKTYAINRVISEYGQRYEDGPKKGKLMVFPSEGRDAEGTRIASFIGGRRVITNIPDDLVADSVIGLIAAPFTFPFQEVLGAAANGFRRSITFTPWFQVKQLIIDAPTAAWVSGVRNPFKLWAGVFSGFVNALEITGDDPVVQILRNAGVGGFQSFHRSARKEREIQLGLLKRSNYAAFLNAIDKVGDASDLAQRVSVYKRVLAEKGDPALALLQASDIIDFQKHGKGRLAQAMRTTVTFMQAYATQLDALAQASVGGNLKGVSREEAKKQFRNTGMLLATATMMYVFMAAADDDYWELDDQTRLRNFYIPGSKKATGHHILIPMTTSAAFFFKAVPELLHNFITSQGTKNEMDKRRTAKALGAAAVDALLGPSPVPTGVKPIAEIAFNHDFYTGGNVVPKGLEGLDSAEQYNASTSNLGHAVSKLTGGALNPIQADHLMRGIGGSVATLGMYFSNLAFPDTRPEPELKQNPIIGNLVAPEVSRKNEELFYDLKEKATGKYKTYQSMLDTDKFDEADKFYEKNQGLIDVYEYVSSMDTDLKEINKDIRRYGKSADKELTPKERTKEINDLKKLKSEILDNVTEFRKEAGF